MTSSLSCFKMVEGFLSLHRFSFSLLLVLYLYLPSLKVSADRTVKIESLVCPPKDCPNKNYSIVHVTADDSNPERNNSIHYLYSTIRSPTIIIAYFEDAPEPKLTINWTLLIKDTNSKALEFNHKIDHLMALVVPRIIAFEDPKDELYYTEKHVKEITTHSLENITWAAPKIKGSTVEFTGGVLGGDITFQCNVSAKTAREEELPSLLYTDNSTRFTFTMKHLTGLDTSSKNTRLGLELFSVTSRKNGDSTCIVARKTIDDEYTPAVFKTIVVNNTGVSDNSYVAWKPVAYTSNVRSLDKQVPSYEYLVTGHVTSNDESNCKPVKIIYPPGFKSIAFAFDPTNMNAYGINVSFGQAKDGWYQKYHYLSWTGLIGYGEPEFDTFSSTILITIIAGLGAPFVVLLCGGLFVGVRKYKENKMASAYSRIN